MANNYISILRKTAFSPLNLMYSDRGKKSVFLNFKYASYNYKAGAQANMQSEHVPALMSVDLILQSVFQGAPLIPTGLCKE